MSGDDKLRQQQESLQKVCANEVVGAVCAWLSGARRDLPCHWQHLTQLRRAETLLEIRSNREGLPEVQFSELCGSRCHVQLCFRHTIRRSCGPPRACIPAVGHASTSRTDTTVYAGPYRRKRSNAVLIAATAVAPIRTSAAGMRSCTHPVHYSCMKVDQILFPSVA